MIRAASVLAAIVTAAALAGAAEQAPPELPMANKLRVLKTGDTVLIRSAFSPEQDLVVNVGKGRNNGQINPNYARLVVSTVEMSAVSGQQGITIHGCGDDAAPWQINGTYIGGNHGCSDVRQIVSLNHGRTPAEIGSAWVDGAGARFYLIRVIDTDTLWFLSENKSTNDVWRFTKTMVGPVLTNAAKAAALAFTNTPPGAGQLWPACRIAKQEYLADGKTPLKDGVVTVCGSLDIVEDYDIVNVGSLLKDILQHPGVEPDFTAARLDGVIANHIVYRFYPNGATVVDYTAKALQDFELAYMGFIQSAKLNRGAYAAQEYYIPKTLPFDQDGMHYDFKSLQDFTVNPAKALTFGAAYRNIEDPANLPERFIQFLVRKDGGKRIREVGYALGYSLIAGLTRPAERTKNASAAIILPGKSYTVAVDRKMGPLIPAGTTFHCIAYRQYFKPGGAEAPTCVYWHPEGEVQVVYADYHRSIDRDVIRLPATWAGRAVTVVEKTPSLTLHADKIGPQGGMEVSVTNGYGYAVFTVKREGL